ncbi:hypothetical protein RZS08_05365, partial [Arthrospira platensis SPKY1]|nr:hypothetical protein [Arthrospira platensis SPKY1]
MLTQHAEVELVGPPVAVGLAAVAHRRGRARVAHDVAAAVHDRALAAVAAAVSFHEGSPDAWSVTDRAADIGT